MALDFPNAPSPGEVFDSWAWDGAKWIPAPNSALIGAPAPIVFFFPGLPPASFQLPVPIVAPLNLPANCVGAVTYMTAYPTADTVFDIYDAVPGGPAGTLLGTVTCHPNGTETWVVTADTLLAGHALVFVAPATQDATLAGVSFTVPTTRA